MKKNCHSIMLCILFVVCSPAAADAATEDPQYEVVKTPMRDGVELVGNLYVPDTTGAFPTILMRTPYPREGIEVIGIGFKKAGYAVLIQSCRGQDGSGGTFIPFMNERNDGLDTLDWISSQKWSNGKVGIWGGSYLGYCGFIMADSGHPAFITMVNASGFADMERVNAPGGAFNLAPLLSWVLTSMMNTSDWTEEYWMKIFLTRPLKDAFNGTHTMFSQFPSMTGKWQDVSMPVYHLSGWYDYLYPSTLVAYNELTKNPDNADNQKLVMGPWYHNQMFSDSTGEGLENFGPESVLGVEKHVAECVRWFDHWLKGKNTGIMEEKPVHLFIQGDNRWIATEDWPVPESTPNRLYLSSREGANSSKGDGRLSEGIDEGQDSFVYDPDNFVPTTAGGRSLFGYIPAVADQRPIENREDVLIYTSEPYEDGLTIVGPVQLELYAASEGRDTDFTAKLVELKKDGSAIYIMDGIVRARYRDSYEKESFIEPGTVYKYTIDLGATAIALEPGSSLRLEVSSSNFPKFNLNPNTEVDPFDATEYLKVRQTIYFSEEHPSNLIFSVLQPDASED